MFRDVQGRAQRIAAYAVCVNDDRQLLLCRLNERTTAPGAWTLPGGGIDFGEHPIDGVVREVLEETGLHVDVAELLTVDSIERVITDFHDGTQIDYHAVRIIYRVSVTGGTLRHETDNSTDQAAWHDRSSFEALRRTEVADIGATFADF